MARNEQGSSSTTKLVLIIVAGGGLALLLCCGGAFWIGKNTIGKMIITDPEAVRTRTAAIVDITIPEMYPPMMAMDMSAVGLPMTMCMYMRSDAQSGVILMEMTGRMAGDQEQMKRQFQQGMQQQQGQNQQINVTSSETRTYRINDEEYEFEFAKGTRPQDNAAARQVTGVIPGKAGAAFLMVTDTEENWDEEEIDAMIESLGAELVETSDAAPQEGTGTDPESAAGTGDEAESPAALEDATLPADGASSDTQ